jgi:hypothetical protein
MTCSTGLLTFRLCCAALNPATLSYALQHGDLKRLVCALQLSILLNASSLIYTVSAEYLNVLSMLLRSLLISHIHCQR